jgi:hypothetical protein
VEESITVEEVSEGKGEGQHMAVNPPSSGTASSPVEEKKIGEDKGAGKAHTQRKGRILLIVIVILVALILAAYFSISVHQSPPVANASYPWTATYDVLFPDGQQEHIGSTAIMALSYQDEVIIDVDGDREKLVVGEQRLISERRAVITMLGFPVVDTNYQMYVTFIGVQGNDDEFFLTIKTSEQVPQFLIDRILPPEIRARPV